MSVDQRGRLLRCEGCGSRFPGPDFRAAIHEQDRPAWDHGYDCHCPNCSRTTRVHESTANQSMTCPDCGCTYAQPPAPWADLRLPVARFFTEEDRDRSLHHLMLSTHRAWVPDEMLTGRAARRFSFYCGDCGGVQQARIWDIATQRDCKRCGTLLIVPAPSRPQPTPAESPSNTDQTASVSTPGVLYCPTCGTRVLNADRSRRTQSYCNFCRAWF